MCAVDTTKEHLEKNYRTLVHASPMPMGVVQDGKYVFVNLAGLRMLGYTSLQEVVGLSVADSVASPSQGDISSRLNQPEDDDDPSFSFEIKLRQPDGATIDIEATFVRIEWHGKPAVLVFGRDLTEQQQVQKLMQQQYREEHRLRERFLASLNDITQAALETPDEQSMLEILAKKLRHLFNADACFLVLWDNTRHTIIPAAVDSDLQLYRERFFSMNLAPNEPTLVEAALDAGQPIIIQDTSKSAQVPRKVSHEFEPVSVMAIPFLAAEQKLGAAMVTFPAGYTFSTTETAWAEQIGRQIALALAKIHLLEETQLRWREAETLRQVGAAVLQSLSLDERIEQILEQLEQVVPYDSASVQLVRHDCMEIVNGRGFKNRQAVIGMRFPLTGENINATVAKGRRPVVLTNVQRDYASYFEPPHGHIGSWMGIPLIARERLIGMLTVDSFEPNYFTERHLRLVVPFANQVAVAIENAQLYEQARQDAETRATLLQEVNHRTKNNLSAIIGLLYAERNHSSLKNDAVFRSVMQDLVNRVNGLSVVHRLLSASAWTPVSLTKITTWLISAAVQSRPATKNVQVNVSPSTVEVTSAQANNLALIINELATNTLKYGLADRTTVHIQVTISEKGDRVRFEYKDDGPGYPEATLRSEKYKVGLYLVKTLVQDGLGGTASFYNDGGAVTIIEFDPGKQ